MNLPSTKSVRTRLTVWYVAVLAAILLVYIAAVFFFQFALLCDTVGMSAMAGIALATG